MGGKEVSEAVVKVAWAAQQETELKALLTAEELENDKLRKSIEVYKKVIEDLELANDAAAAAALHTDPASTAAGQETAATPDWYQMYDQLRDKLLSFEFLQQLGGNGSAKPLDPLVLQTADQEAGAWLLVSDDNVLAKEETDGLGTSDGYLVITQQDIVDGVACFVALSISSLPESKDMHPEELQQAIISAFTELQKTGKLRNLWNCAHLLYAVTSWGSTALGLYKNPVIRRAAWMAVYTSCSIILRLFP